MTLATFFSEGGLDSTAAFVWAGLIGLAFGFWLERAGFGSSRKLTAIFYLRDFAVFQVMFTAIVTALVGLRVLVAFGRVDPGSVYQMETFMTPQIVAGLIFGVGFVMGGWCPGTALVGLASGKGDALVFLGGASIGSLVYAAVWPAVRDFAVSGACGICTIPETFGLSPGLTVLLVVLIAFAAFAGVEALSRHRARTTGDA